MSLPARKASATVVISRAGVECSITEPVDVDTVTDGYGKAEEDSWNEVSVEPVVRIYQRGSQPDQARVSGGRYRTDSPVLLFIRDSAVEEGFRVSFESSLYEVNALTFYPTHIEAEVTAVN
jgi:hypothetical protein